MGVVEQSLFPLRAGYSVTLMDARAHGQSEGRIATYGATRAHLLVVAEAPFASFREAAYDYAGLQKCPLLGKTLFAPGAWVLLARGQR